MSLLVDALVVLCIAALGYWGFQEGLAAQLARIACVVLGILATSWASPPLAERIDRELHSAWSYPLAYGMILIGISLAAWLLSRMIRGAVDASALKVPDRVAGAAAGIAAGWLLATGLTMAALHARTPSVRSAVRQSAAGPALVEGLSRVRALLSERDRETLGRRIESAGERARDLTRRP